MVAQQSVTFHKRLPHTNQRHSPAYERWTLLSAKRQASFTPGYRLLLPSDLLGRAGNSRRTRCGSRGTTMRLSQFGTLTDSLLTFIGREQSTDDCRANLPRPDTAARAIEMLRSMRPEQVARPAEVAPKPSIGRNDRRSEQFPDADDRSLATVSSPFSPSVRAGATSVVAVFFPGCQ